MIDENGVDVGRTWRDVLQEANDALVTLLNSSAKRIDGEGWTAYKVGTNIIRVDFKVPPK